MRFHESPHSADRYVNPVLTIGNYDGLHLGHRRIIELVRERARAISGTSMLMTFHPHPLSIMKPEKQLGLITPLSVKKRLIEETGIDVLLVLPFTDDFRLSAPEVFVKEVLLDRLGIKWLIVGYDFRFGRDGKGDTVMLKTLSEEHGFFFEVVAAITLDGEKIGSNRIRRLILDGQVDKASHFLGRPYVIEGLVTRGEGRGRVIGFPTLNLETQFDLIPKRGVYISEVDIGGKRFPSVTNVGYNPTFDGRNLSIETYILDFSEDIYGREVALHFYERLRDELKFNGVEELKERIGLDVEMARAYFNKAV
jgi:riboflavin kinase / FMN adenylyltransferase